MAPHTGSATPEQIDTLLNFLDEHRDLAVGKLRNIEGKVQAKRLWEELCNTLNSMGGCTKTVQQWQKLLNNKEEGDLLLALMSGADYFKLKRSVLRDKFSRTESLLALGLSLQVSRLNLQVSRLNCRKCLD
ncbi:hypothetical protein ACJJTC_016813 [Scirpophaga incertulas]